MAKRRRKRGMFDPDYRTEGWNQSVFAPKRGCLNITQVSLLITLIPVAVLYALPETRRILLTLQGVIILIIGIWVVWLMLALLIRRVEWRRLQKHSQPIPLIFEENQAPRARLHLQRKPKQPTENPKPETIKTPSRSKDQPSIPVNPIETQLAERRARLGMEESPTMTPRDFEHEVAQLVTVLTKHKAVVVGGSGDGGVDVMVYEGNKVVGVVQCKRYSSDKPLPPNHIRELAAVKQKYRANTAYLFTTAYFSPESKREAESLGVRLVDKDEFQRLKESARARLRDMRNDTPKRR